jgi:hypothetical protein
MAVESSKTLLINTKDQRASKHITLSLGRMQASHNMSNTYEDENDIEPEVRSRRKTKGYVCQMTTTDL